MRRGAAAAAIVFLVATAALAVRGVRTRRMGIGWTSTHVVVSFRFGDLFSRRVREDVDKSLTTTILARLRVYRDGNEDASVGGSARTCNIHKDVWDEGYHVTIADRTGERAQVLRTFQEMVRACTDLRQMPVAPRIALRSGRTYRVSAQLEVNPLSKESVRRIQRWLRSPEPTAAGESGSAIFGSVTSLFVRPRIGQAERTLLLRSQTFSAP